MSLKYDRYTRKELLELLKNHYPTLKERTLNNALTAIISMLDRSPIGGKMMQGILTKKGKSVKLIDKIGTDDIHPIVIAYSLYKYAEIKNRYNFTISEFYSHDCDGGPYKLFGISKDKLENILRGLQENKYQIVRVDLAANLDNIFLKENFSSIEVLRILTE
jgi:phosphoadenosine phosphosulfate reductase